MKTLVMLPFICMVMHARAQPMRQPLAIPYLSLSAYSAQQQNAFSFTGNQAALAKTAQSCIGVYAERRFMLADINAYSLAAVLPSHLGNFGLQVNYAGFKNFNENKTGLAYARSMGSKAAVGVQFNYYSYRIPGYAGASAVHAEAGAIFNISSSLHAGVQLYHPVAVNGGSIKSVAYKFGLGYDASENFFIAAAIIKETAMHVNVHAGFQYQFARQFFARAGFLSATSALYAGAGLGWKNLRVDISSSYHPQLGLSPGIALFANFKTPREKDSDVVTAF